MRREAAVRRSGHLTVERDAMRARITYASFTLFGLLMMLVLWAGAP